MLVKRPYPTKTIKIRPAVLPRLKLVGRTLGIGSIADTVEALVEGEIGRLEAKKLAERGEEIK